MLKKLFNLLSTLKPPFMLDPSTGRADLTYMLSYLAGISAIISAILVVAEKATIESSLNFSLLLIICLVFYRLGRLDKVKFDLDDKSFELDSEDENGDKKAE